MTTNSQELLLGQLALFTSPVLSCYYTQQLTPWKRLQLKKKVGLAVTRVGVRVT